ADDRVGDAAALDVAQDALADRLGRVDRAQQLLHAVAAAQHGLGAPRTALRVPLDGGDAEAPAVDQRQDAAADGHHRPVGEVDAVAQVGDVVHVEPVAVGAPAEQLVAVGGDRAAAAAGARADVDAPDAVAPPVP